MMKKQLKYLVIPFACILVCFISACDRSDVGPAGTAPSGGYAAETTPLQDTLSIGAIVGHLQELSAIAAANNGHRKAGSEGYDASAGYVDRVLSGTNLVLTEQEIGFRYFEETTDPVVEQIAPVARRCGALPSPLPVRWGSNIHLCWYPPYRR